jgi:hypothetical protein
MQKNGDTAPSAVLAKFFSGCKIPIFSLSKAGHGPLAEGPSLDDFAQSGQISQTPTAQKNE